MLSFADNAGPADAASSLFIIWECARELYSRTPLDFLKSPLASMSIIAPFWFSMGVVFNMEKESHSRPIKRVGNLQDSSSSRDYCS